MTTARTARFRGRSPPDRDSEWTVSTINRQMNSDGGVGVCAVTDETISLSQPHFHVTLRRESEHRFRSDEHDQLVISEAALDELDEWLESKD